MQEINYEEGEICNRNGCKGIIKCYEKDTCSCHINPPCSSCTEPRAYCETCKWDELEEVREKESLHTNICKELSWGVKIKTLSDLDNTKIDYIVEGHSNSSQKVIGVYPEGTSMEEVEKIAKGSWGGRFKRFENGNFVYIAYTD